MAGQFGFPQMEHRAPVNMHAGRGVVGGAGGVAGTRVTMVMDDRCWASAGGSPVGRTKGL